MYMYTHIHTLTQMTAYQEVNGDNKRLYSCHVTKLNRRLKSDQRVFVLCDKNLYRLTSDYQLAKRGTIELEMITGLSVSTGKDQTIVIHCVVSQKKIFSVNFIKNVSDLKHHYFFVLWIVIQ